MTVSPSSTNDRVPGIFARPWFSAVIFNGRIPSAVRRSSHDVIRSCATTATCRRLSGRRSATAKCRSPMSCARFSSSANGNAVRIFDADRTGMLTVVVSTSTADTSTMTGRSSAATAASDNVPLETSLRREPVSSASIHSTGWSSAPSRMTKYSGILRWFPGCEESWLPARHSDSATSRCSR